MNKITREEALRKLTKREKKLWEAATSPRETGVVEALLSYGNLWRSIDSRLGAGNPVTWHFVDTYAYNKWLGYSTSELNYTTKRAEREFLNSEFLPRSGVPSTVRERFAQSAGRLQDEEESTYAEIRELEKKERSLKSRIHRQNRFMERLAETMRPTDVELRNKSNPNFYRNLILSDFDKVALDDPVFERIQSIRGALKMKGPFGSAVDGTYDVIEKLNEMQQSMYDRSMTGKTYQSMMRGTHPIYEQLRNLNTDIEFGPVDSEWRYNNLKIGN